MTSTMRGDPPQPISGRLRGSILGFGMLVTSIGVVATPSPGRLAGYEALTGSWIPATPQEPVDACLLTPIAVWPSGESRTLSAVERSTELIKKVHADSGLTWDQLSRLFGVSRRALHHWASGGRLNATNYELLERANRVIDNLPGIGPAEKRSELLRPRSGGMSIFDEIRGAHASKRGDVNSLPYEPSQLVGIEQD
jgi:hypothetical protein